MTAILEPRQTWQIVPQQALTGVQEQRVLMVGQMLAAGTATAGDLIQDLPSDNSEDTLLGQRSHLAGMVRNFKRENKTNQLDIIPLDDAGASSPATAVITFSVGPATEDGEYEVIIGSKKDHSYTVNVLDTDVVTDIGDALVTAITADADAPFTAANIAGAVTITAENDGTLADDWHVEITGTVAGVTLAVTGWSGGGADPTLTSVLDVIGEIRYQTIIWPSNYDLDVVETLLNARFNSAGMIQDGIAFQAKKGTLSTLKAYAVQNSQSIVVVGNKTVNETLRKGTAVPEMPDTEIAQQVGFRALKTTEPAPLATYLTSVAPLDQFGSIANASLPYFNTVIPNTEVGVEGDEWTFEEQVELTANGVAIFGPNRVFNGAIWGQYVTTYLTDGAGNPDDSFKFVETVDTASVIREFNYENCRTRYAQTRLTDGDLVDGRDMANAASIRAFLNELYDELAENTLTQAGSIAKKDFNDNLVISTNIRTGTATINMAPLLVTQLRVILGTIQINFGG